MISIELTDTQKPLLEELNGLLKKIEAETAIAIDATLGDEVAYHLTRRIELQHHEGRIIELATSIYDHCKGKAFEEAMLNATVTDAKQDLQRLWFAGKLARWNALYEKALRTIKALDASIDGLRTILSREKEMMKANINNT